MQIFINGDKWATRQINFADWKPYEITEEKFKQLSASEIVIDPEATTDKTLKFLTAAKMATFKKEISTKRKVREWARKATAYLLDHIFDLNEKQQVQYTLLRDYFDRKRIIPPLSQIQAAQPELYDFLDSAVKNGDLPIYPTLLDE